MATKEQQDALALSECEAKKGECVFEFPKLIGAIYTHSLAQSVYQYETVKLCLGDSSMVEVGWEVCVVYKYVIDIAIVDVRSVLLY